MPRAILRPGGCHGTSPLGHEGAISLRGLLKFSALVFLACLLFLVVDVWHRVAGYQAIHGQGIRGTVTVTSCEQHRSGTFCTGDFASADGRVTRPGVRINGAAELLKWTGEAGRPAPAAHVSAALSVRDAGEAWTLDGLPWLRPSPVTLTALAPVAIALILVWAELRDIPTRRRFTRMRQGGWLTRTLSGR
jgi:hypothetical protein